MTGLRIGIRVAQLRSIRLYMVSAAVMDIIFDEEKCVTVSSQKNYLV